MVINSFYINQNPNKACSVTELHIDEIELLVGKFAKHSIRAGQLRGEIIEYIDGTIEIRHHFNKKVLWSSNGYI